MAEFINQEQINTLGDIKNQLKTITLHGDNLTEEELYEIRWALINLEEAVSELQWDLFFVGSKYNLKGWTESSMSC